MSLPLPRPPPRRSSRPAPMPDLVSEPAVSQTVPVKARLAAAGLSHGTARPGPAPAAGGEPASARVSQARSRARERGDAQRQALRPLGWAFIAIVVTASVQTHPAPGLRGAGLDVTLALAVYTAAVATAITVGWARRGLAAQAVVIGLIEVSLGVCRRDPVTTTSSTGAAVAVGAGASWAWSAETPAAAVAVAKAKRTACCKLRLFAMC